MTTIAQIQREVGEWSYENFGNQPTNLLYASPCFDGDGIPTDDHIVSIDSLAPLMGIVEELGEMAYSIHKWDKAEIRDALGDIFIYLCDYATREDFELPWGERSGILGYTENGQPAAMVGMWISVGRLYHATLKRHQGIRGFDAMDKYEFVRNKAVDWLMVHACRFVNVHLPQTTVLDIVRETWEGVVKKRNWKSNKEQGNADTTKNENDGQES